MNSEARHSQLQADGIVLDFARNTIRGTTSGDEIRLEPRPMALLRFFTERSGEVLTRSEIIDHVWSGAYGADQSLTNAVSQLRKALRNASPNPPAIETVPKTGYVFRATNLELLHRDHVSQKRSEDASVRNARDGHRLFYFASIGVTALLVIAALFYFNRDQPNTETSREVLSIAVVSFADTALESGRSPFGDAFAEAILNEIATSDRLNVSGKASAFSFDPQRISKSLPDIASALDVGFVLHGVIQRQDGNVRATVRLYDAALKENVWLHSFQASFSDLYALERRIAVEAAAQLKIALPERRTTMRQPIPSVFDAYLDARALTATRRLEDVQAGVNLLEWAVRADPLFADGYSQLGYSRNVLATLLNVEGAARADYLVEAENDVDAALAIAPENVLALTTKAIMELRKSHFDDAERLFKRAIAANPSAGDAYNWYGDLLGMIGRKDEQIIAEEKAVKLDPLLVSNHYNLAQAYAVAGEFDKAMSAIEHALHIDPWHPIVLEIEAIILFRAEDRAGLQDFSDKIADLETKNDGPLSKRRLRFLKVLPSVFMDALDGEAVDVQLAVKDQELPPLLVASIYAHLGEYDRAAAILEQRNSATFFIYSPFYFPTGDDIFERNPAYEAFWSREPRKTLLELRAKSG